MMAILMPLMSTLKSKLKVVKTKSLKPVCAVFHILFAQINAVSSHVVSCTLKVKIHGNCQCGVLELTLKQKQQYP